MSTPTTPAPTPPELIPLIAEPAAAAETACCAPAQQATCCEPSAKAACCGASPASACGCKG